MLLPACCLGAEEFDQDVEVIEGSILKYDDILVKNRH